MIIELLILLISLAIVVIVSDKVIVYVSKLSFYFGISEISAGFILLAVSTSLPELFIAILSPITNASNLSVGNVIGANISNLTIVVSLAILLSKNKLSIKTTTQKKLSEFLFLTSFLTLLIIQRESLGHVLGIILLTLFIYFSLKISKVSEVKPLGYFRRSEASSTAIKFLISIAILLFASKVIIDNSSEIAIKLGLPLSVIGATIVSIGTTLPELITTTQALRKHFHEMALGNILGSCITNLTLILGLTALLSSSEINIIAVSSMLFFMLFSTLAMWHLINTREYLGRRIAFFLILLYAIFVIQQIGFSIFIF